MVPNLPEPLEQPEEDYSVQLEQVPEEHSASQLPPLELSDSPLAERREVGFSDPPAKLVPRLLEPLLRLPVLRALADSVRIINSRISLLSALVVGHN